jgi:hypothetical protein
MASDNLISILRTEAKGFPGNFDTAALDRALTEPQQEALAEAIAADAVDAVPFAGDALTLTRMDKAERRGVEYPERPSSIENILSDIPAPFDTVGDVLVSQNVLKYLENNYDVDFPNRLDGLVDESARSVDNVVDNLLPDT